MLRKSFFRKLNLFLLAFIFLCFLTNIQSVITFLGEKLFLTYHHNSLAIKVLEKSDLNNNYKANFLLGRIYFVEGGRENLFKSIEYFDKSIGLIEVKGETRRKNPQDFSFLSQSFYGLGLSYGFLGDIYLINAEENFKKYIELEDRKEKEIGKRSYGSWAGFNDLAWIQYLQGNFRESEKTAKKGLDISYQNPWLLNMLGINQIEQRNCKDGKRNLEKAFEILEKINDIKWGEAYSGDPFSQYAKGKQDMLDSIKANIKICEK